MWNWCWGAYGSQSDLRSHAAKQLMMHAILNCEPECRLNGCTRGSHFFRTEPGAQGYKLHAIWIIERPATGRYPQNLKALWGQGSLHLIVSATRSGFTRLRLDPAPNFEKEAAALVLCYVGDWEAMYESWNASERKGGPWPVALEALFRNVDADDRWCSSRTVDCDMSGLDESQKAYLTTQPESCCPPIFDGVCGSGKTHLSMIEESS